jgi:DNA-binding response OmpR family regulator
MRILVIEDEEKLAEAIRQGLTLKGYAVDTVADGEKGLTRISLYRDDYDLVILDLMLPTMDGYSILRGARENGVTVPILVLTARSESETKVKLLQAGADDYLVKPFSFDELMARIQALLRRPAESLPEVLKAQDIIMNLSERRVYRDGKEIPLTLKEFGMLEYFMRHPNQVINREDMLSHLWDFNFTSFSNVVDVHVKNLRKKLGSVGDADILETIRGIGYRLRE